MATAFPRLLLNETYFVYFGDARAHVRVQKTSSGHIRFSCEPERGSADEIPTITFLELMRDLVKLMRFPYRPLFRTDWRGNGRVDILESVIVETAELPAETLLQMAHDTAVSRLH